MPDSVEFASHSEGKAEWVPKFQTRLMKAKHFLQGNQPINLTRLRHLEDFREVLKKEPRYRKEVQSLTSIEFEILCMASTDRQARRDAEFFVASDMTISDGFVKAEQRNKIRAAISNEAPFLKSIYRTTQTNEPKASEKDRIRDLKEWLSCTLNNVDIRHLVNLLVAHLAENNYTPRPKETQHVNLSISRLGLNPPGPLFLTADQRTILHVIHCAGGQVPHCFLTPALVWTTAGNLGLTAITVPEVFDDHKRKEKTLQSMLDEHILIRNKENGYLMVNPGISSEPEQDVDYWRLTTLAVTCRAFPEWPHLLEDPVRCKSLMPIIHYVLAYIPRTSLDRDLQSSLIDMCISASYFGDLPWKGSMLRIASGLTTRDTVLSHKLAMRIRMLYRLLRRDDIPVEILNPRLLINSPQSNAQFGEQIVYEMQVLVDQRARIEDIEKHFAKFEPWHPLSAQEQQVSLRGEEIITKAMRFQGRLKDAEERYIEHISRYPKNAIPARFMASYTELLCDLGEPERALKMLNAEFEYRKKGVGRRLEMAVSQAHLTAGLWDFARGKFDEKSARSLKLAEARFGTTKISLEREGLGSLCQTNRGHYFVACAGLAMVEHIAALMLVNKRDGTLDEQLRTALKAWDTAFAAHEAARASWSRPGYSEVVILFSKSQLLHHLEHPSAKETMDATEIMDSAKWKYVQTGRHYHVVAHGTVWLEIVKPLDVGGRMAFWEVVGE